jgi:VanZ family protein
MTRTAKSWLPVVLWMAVIFFMSTDFGSAAHTSRILEPLVRWFDPNASTDDLDWVHFLVRKTGHLSEYAVLALLLLRATRRSLQIDLSTWSWRAASLSLLIATAYAATDEFHQFFVPGRTPAVHDVLIDSAGATLALIMAFLWRPRFLFSLGGASVRAPS